ncbi:MAG TPA: hypothetical protein VFN36_07430 [Solirubrobacteraceae bacterium]|nr:hypothetical protein [Solirubrobacteraceae bacterium]
MVLPLLVSALVALALVFDLVAPRVRELWAHHRARRRFVEPILDPGQERRAEQTARELLRSCVGEEEWSMYRELGFIRVWGSHPSSRSGGVEHAYLIYPHRPIVAYAPQTGRLLGEYCVEFPDVTRPYGSARLPDSDDVLAKWMALTGDERRLLASANLHLPGRQVDASQVQRDLWRLSRWEQARLRDVASALDAPHRP